MTVGVVQRLIGRLVQSITSLDPFGRVQSSPPPGANVIFVGELFLGIRVVARLLDEVVPAGFLLPRASAESTGPAHNYSQGHRVAVFLARLIAICLLA